MDANAVLAAAIGKHRNIQATAVAAFTDHPSFPRARKAKRGLIDASLSGQVAITPVSYQEIIDIARQLGLVQKLGLIFRHGWSKRSQGPHRGHLSVASAD